MTGHISLCLLLFLMGCCDCSLPGTISPVQRAEAARYCRISANHTMCRFPRDEPAAGCASPEAGELSGNDIATVLSSHNYYRDRVARGEEHRGDLGPQPAAKYLMEMIWDEELAHIARRWALQCRLLERDQCRDVERFGVWQNVNVLDIDSVGSNTSTARIYLHIQSWYDEVEHFDSVEVGTNTSQTAVGIRPEKATRSGDGAVERRVETLVCNYGPLDRKTPRELYEYGEPGLCPPGTIRSPRYAALCTHRQRMQASEEDEEEDEEEEPERTNNSALPIARVVYLGQLILLVHLSM